MKTAIKIFVVMFVLNVASVVCPEKASAQGPMSYQVFYDELSPYGEWMMYPNYGYVWVPNAGPFFSPYQTSGHWVFTNYGWTWASDYQWGWAPFHYGRWDRDPYYGWIWIPGHEWGPAWVSWRRCEGYYGWAPIAPGISLEYAYGRDYYPPQERWVFCDERYIDDPYVSRYYAPRGENHRYIERGEVIHNRHDERERGYYYNEGPRREEVERGTHRRVETMEVRNHDRPGQDMDRNSLSIYRPEIHRGKEKDNSIPAPRRITDKDNIRPEKERPNVNKDRTETDKPIIKGDERNKQNKGMDEQHRTPENKVTPDNRNQQHDAPVKPREEQPFKKEEGAPKPANERGKEQQMGGQPAKGNLFESGPQTQPIKPQAQPGKQEVGRDKKADKKDAKVKTPEVKDKRKVEEPVKKAEEEKRTPR